MPMVEFGTMAVHSLMEKMRICDVAMAHSVGGSAGLCHAPWWRESTLQGYLTVQGGQSLVCQKSHIM